MGSTIVQNYNFPCKRNFPKEPEALSNIKRLLGVVLFFAFRKLLVVLLTQRWNYNNNGNPQ